MEYGIVYLLTNPYMPGLVKIGMTKQEDLEKRMKELYTTGVPVAFECQFACRVNNKDCAKIERAYQCSFCTVKRRKINNYLINGYILH